METPWHFLCSSKNSCCKEAIPYVGLNIPQPVPTAFKSLELPSQSTLSKDKQHSLGTLSHSIHHKRQSDGSEKIGFWLICPGYSQTTSCLTKRVDMAVRKICPIKYLKAKADQPVGSPTFSLKTCVTFSFFQLLGAILPPNPLLFGDHPHSMSLPTAGGLELDDL